MWNNLYESKNESTNQLFICLYVDDTIYMGSSPTMANEFKKEMMHTFEMSDLGLLQYFLGLEVKQSDGAIGVTKQICQGPTKEA